MGSWSAAPWRARLTVVVVALLGTGAFGAPAKADESEGRRRWKRGEELYAKGRYLDAAREFEAGFAAAPRPVFLLNIGHAYRRAQELSKAKEAYRRYLDQGGELPQRTDVEGYIRSIDDALQLDTPEPARPSAPVPPPAPAPPPLTLIDPSTVAARPATTGDQPPAPHPMVADTRPRDTDQPASRSVFTKPWFWLVVGTVVAGGITAAVIATRPSNSCTATVCISE